MIVAVSIVGASVPLYMTTRSLPGSLGAAFGVVALTLAAVNRRSREQQLEDLVRFAVTYWPFSTCDKTRASATDRIACPAFLS